jgi:hypothetical protein
MDRDRLDSALLAAHERNDLKDLVRLYTLAGNQSEMAKDIDAACFYLTHAFVFALESGAPEAQILNRRLADRGRAKRLEF